MSRNPGQRPSSPRIARRWALLAGVAVIGGGAVFGARWFNVTAEVGEAALSAQQAHQMALDGKIALVDIRRPDEWARTGVPEGGLALDMRAPDFTDILFDVVKGATDAPIALICARGVRSRKMATRLRAAGFTNVLDVPEGMLGSGACPGWVRQGLPVVAR